MPSPLPLAPRPNPGEAITSWVERMGARYDVTGHDLLRHVLGRFSIGLGRAERLDHRADEEVEAALAAAARISPARIKALRIVRDDGSASCWHRRTPAWCRACVQTDLDQRGEVFQRAAWRLGSTVVCPEHCKSLEDRCRRCLDRAFCRFEFHDGIMRLVCSECAHPVDLRPLPMRDAPRANEGAFGIAITPALTNLVKKLQCDLQAALAGTALKSHWGHAQSPEGLLIVVMHLTLCIVLTTGVKCEPRIELPDPKPGQSFDLVYQPITPAALSQSVAYGVLAVAAIFLLGLGGEHDLRHQWRPDGVRFFLDVRSFLAWLPPNRRQNLKAWSKHWAAPMAQALDQYL